MTVGVALLLIAAGAILRYAVTAHLSGVDLRTVGAILMAVGAVGLVIAVVWLFSGRRRRTRVLEQQAYLQAQPTAYPPDPYRGRVEDRRYEDPPV